MIARGSLAMAALAAAGVAAAACSAPEQLLAVSSDERLEEPEPHPSCRGRRLYIAPAGRDEDPGTEAEPFATLARAGREARPGDTVYLRGGVYAFPVLQNIASVGTPTAHICFVPYPGEKVVLDGSRVNPPQDPGRWPNEGFIMLTGSYLDFGRFEVANAHLNAIHVQIGKHVKVFGNVVHDCQHSGIYVGLPSNTVDTFNVHLVGNVVYRTVLSNANRAWMYPGPAAAIFGARDIVMVGNEIRDSHGPALQIMQTDRALVGRNVIRDAYGQLIYMQDASNLVIERNFLHATGTAAATAYYREGKPPAAVEINDQMIFPRNPLRAVRIVNNVTVGTNFGVLMYGGKMGLVDFLVAHNTFFRSAIQHIALAPGPHLRSVVANNVFLQPGTMEGLAAAMPSEGLVFHHNAWFGGGYGRVPGPGDVIADPQLASPGGSTPADHRPSPGSPLIDAGETVPGVTEDFLGNARPLGAGADMGAFEAR